MEGHTYEAIAAELAAAYGVEGLSVLDESRGDRAYEGVVGEPSEYRSSASVVLVRLTSDRVRRLEKPDLERAIFHDAVTAIEVFAAPHADAEGEFIIRITDTELGLDDPYVAYFRASKGDIGLLYGRHIQEYWGVSHLDEKQFDEQFARYLSDAYIFNEAGEPIADEVVELIDRVRGAE